MKKIGSISQIIWYAKNKFEITETFSDLRKIIAEVYYLNEKHIDLDAMRNILVNVCAEVGCFDNMREKLDFIRDIAPNKYYQWVPSTISQMWKDHPDYNYDMAVIYKCLSMLCLLNVLDDNHNRIFEFDEPDFNILPKYAINK